jgi:hypothetical protein
MITGTKGGFFIKKDSENDPFIMKYYLPQCPKVGPYYSVRSVGENNWLFIDWNDYEDKEINDQEFAELYKNKRTEQLAPTEYAGNPNLNIQSLRL